ncbi:MAG: Hpt domain-containing protein, partial [Acidimicrobiia bacterium]|nr:Hpt domain-containing protein [Acidimicrobiia bacterium]
LPDALGRGDREVLHRAAHTLKSSNANMGARRLSKLCAELEGLCRDAIPDDASASIGHIVGERDRVERTLAARRQQLSSQPPASPSEARDHLVVPVEGVEDPFEPAQLEGSLVRRPQATHADVTIAAPGTL